MGSKPIVKALIALVGTAIFAVGGALQSDGKIDTGEWLYIAAAILGAGALTYIATNVTGVLGGAIKALVAGGGAFVAALIAAYQPDSLLSTSEFLIAASAAITVLVGTYEIPDPPPPNPSN
jgi:hypothetical protein